jgi:hypothetical protein
MSNVLIYLLNVLTPWSRVFLEKLNGLQLVKKFSAFYWTRRFITAFTIARHLSLSWASPIQSIPPKSHSLKIHLNIIFPPTPGSPQWSLSLEFPHQNPIHTSLLPHPRYMLRPSHSSWIYHPHNIWSGVQIMKLLILKYSPLPCFLVPLMPNILNTLFSNTLSLSSTLNVSDQVSYPCLMYTCINVRSRCYLQRHRSSSRNKQGTAWCNARRTLLRYEARD